MKKILLLFAAMCSAAMMQAQVVYDVPYIDENGVEQICKEATVVNRYGPFTWTEGWYVLDDEIENYERRCIVCQGDVRLILAGKYFMEIQGYDGHAGIEVSGEGNSLTIYGQKEQEGRLIARGGKYSAGIGGSGEYGVGNNITINGGRVEAYGGDNSAGIGGGLGGSATNITINGGVVFALGTSWSAGGIGYDYYGKASNIFLADRVKALTCENYSVFTSPESRKWVEHSSIEDDIVSDVNGMSIFASIDFTPFFAVIDEAAGDVQDDILLQFVNAEKQKMVDDPMILTYDEAVAARNLAKEKVKAAKELVQYLPDDEMLRKEEYIEDTFNLIASLEGIEQIEKQKNIGIGLFQGFTAGVSYGNTSALGSLGTKQNGPALIVTDKDDNEIILYSPKRVEYIKVNDK